MIWTLVKINFRALFAGLFRRYQGKKKMKPVTAILIGLLVVYIVGALLVTVGIMFYGFCPALFDAGIGWFYFALAGLLVFALCFIGSVFMVQTQIFAARDNELLLSMPIKPSAIITGRVSALLIIEYFFEALILIPVFAVLLITGYISSVPALGIAFFFGAALLLPLVALALGCLIGWLLTLMTSRMRNKNILTLVLSVGFLVAYFWLYTKMMSNIGELMINGVEIAEAVRRAVFPAYHLGTAIANGSVASFLIFSAFAILPFAAMCALLSISFVKLVTGGRGAKKIEYREKTLRVSGARAALLRRELLHFWSQPMYILNAALGAIASIILTVVLIARPSLILGLFDPEAGMLYGLLDPGITGAIILSALTPMNFVSAPSISLEGKRLWIVKSLPVHPRDILISKIWLHLSVCGIPSLIAGIACIITIPMSAVQAVLTLIMPASATLMFALFGLTLNLAFPRFDWINPIQPVKQGMSAMFSLLGGFALITVLAGIYAALPTGKTALEIYLLICTAFFAAASAGLYAYLANAGGRKFETL